MNDENKKKVKIRPTKKLKIPKSELLSVIKEKRKFKKDNGCLTYYKYR